MTIIMDILIFSLARPMENAGILTKKYLLVNQPINQRKMDRKDFLKIGALTGASTIIGTNNAFAQNLTKNNMDKLVDAN
jgi:hypothetical protein